MYLQSFLLASLISFAGSLQVGVVNVSVAYTTLHQNRKAAFWVALGGSLPEAFYATLAIGGADLVVQWPSVWNMLSWVYIPLCLGMGIYFVRKPYQPLQVRKSHHKTSFLQGLALGFLNPMLFTFWVSVLLLLKSYRLFDAQEFFSSLLFVAGTSFGALLFLLLVACLFHRLKERIHGYVLGSLNKATGLLFLAIAFLQVMYHWQQIITMITAPAH